MVVEADKSDGTFIKLPTEIGVVTNIDPEHLDYYGTEAGLHEAFLIFFRQIPQYGLAVPGIDHPVVRKLIDQLPARVPCRRWPRSAGAPTRTSRPARSPRMAHGGLRRALRDMGRPSAHAQRGIKMHVPGITMC